MGNLVIVSNRLPVAVKKADGKLLYSRPIGGLATGLSSYTKSKHNKWIGWPGIASDELTTEDKQDITIELKKHNCYPVWLSKAQIDGFYNGYSNGILWPLFHDVKPDSKALKEEPAYWQAYQEVNALFAETVARLSGPEDRFWIHDYLLMLLPGLLRQLRPAGHIGFFLHIPFPPPEKYKQVKRGEIICTALLGADILGLQTESYVRDFFANLREYGIGIVSSDGVVLDGHSTEVTHFPIGIDYQHYVRSRSAPAVAREYLKFTTRYRGKRVIISVDRQDPAKGILERLQAYHAFLVKYPEYRGKVVYVALVVPSRTEVPIYKQLKTKLDAAVEKTNTTFSTRRWKPIDYIYDGWEFDKLTALYRRADVAFVTPRRDGMNLVSKEYLASRGSKDSGVLILSETAGSAAELQDAILVNPNSQLSLVKGLAQALTLSETEKRSRTRSMQRYLREHTVQQWANSFIHKLEQPIVKTRNPTKTLTSARQATLRQAYATAKSRLIVLDYDGTLSHFTPRAEDAKPNPQVKVLLRRLGSNPANKVVLMSGRSRKNLEKWFGSLPVTLAAEHGAAYLPRSNERWQITSTTVQPWRSKVQNLFDYYAALTPGALVEQKEWALVWHYHTAKPYTAQKHLVAIRRLLQPIAKQYGLRVKNGHKVVEVHAGDISKGKTVERWLAKNPDFVLCIGDDVTDEDMLAVLPAQAYGIKVGRGPTAARFRLANVAEVLDLLENLLTSKQHR